jgi:FG-GAP repeat
MFLAMTISSSNDYYMPHKISPPRKINHKVPSLISILAIFLICTPTISFALSANAPNLSDPITFRSPNAQPVGFFGHSVASATRGLLVGASGESVNGMSFAGHAYFFRFSPIRPLRVHSCTIQSPNAQRAGEFGWSVGTAVGFMVISGPNESVGTAPGAGNVYVYASPLRTGFCPRYLYTIPNPNPAANSLLGYDPDFGYSVAASNGIIVVGAPGDAIYSAQSAGEAYIYSEATGSLLWTLVSPNSQAGGLFGESVAIDGNTVVIGAPGESAPGPLGTGPVQFAGRAYIFAANTGALVATLTGPSPNIAGDFGVSVAVGDNSVFVGADNEPVTVGGAFQFSLTGSPGFSITDPDTINGETFGGSVAVAGTLLVVGADLSLPGNLTEAGEAFVFNAGTGTLLRTLISPNNQMDGEFGFAVATNGVEVVVAAQGEMVNGNGLAGHVYIFG